MLQDRFVAPDTPTLKVQSPFRPLFAPQRHACFQRMSHKIQQHQKAESNETPQNNAISPLLRPNPPNQTINPRNLARSSHYPPINTSNRLALYSKLLIDSVRLAQHPIRYTVAIVYPPPLIEHIVCFCVGRVGAAVGGDVGADVGEEVGARAGFINLGGETGEFVAVIELDLSVSG